MEEPACHVSSNSLSILAIALLACNLEIGIYIYIPASFLQLEQIMGMLPAIIWTKAFLN